MAQTYAATTTGGAVTPTQWATAATTTTTLNSIDLYTIVTTSATTTPKNATSTIPKTVTTTATAKLIASTIRVAGNWVAQAAAVTVGSFVALTRVKTDRARLKVLNTNLRVTDFCRMGSRKP